MDTLLSRFRNITVLLLVILAQLVLIAVQVRSDKDVPMIRVWSVTAITPLARVLETVRGGAIGFFRDYITVHDAREENRRLQSDVDRLKMDNLFLKTELSTADRAKALAAFQARTPSRTLAARVIASGASANSKVVFLDRGSGAGVERGMPVVTPDGIVGKVIAAYPTASEVMLITDPDFAAGVESQKNHVTGTLKGQGHATCKVDYVPNEEKVDVGEWFYTSGEDRIFPKGFPVGIARVVRNGSPNKEIVVEPSGLERGLEAVLIMLEGVHQAIPDKPPADAPIYMGTPPPPSPGQTAKPPEQPEGTAADRLREHYAEIGEAQGHKFGENPPGSKAVDFNLKIPAKPVAAPPPSPGGHAPDTKLKPAGAPAAASTEPKPAGPPHGAETQQPPQ